MKLMNNITGEYQALPEEMQWVSIRYILISDPFQYLSDRFLYPFIYLSLLNPYSFIYLKPEKGTPFGESLPI